LSISGNEIQTSGDQARDFLPYTSERLRDPSSLHEIQLLPPAEELVKAQASGVPRLYRDAWLGHGW
jgi:hypothetical protein